MDNEVNGQVHPFQVDLSGNSKSLLRQLHRQARDAGISKQFLVALRQIIERLQSDPHRLGEPLYRLPALKLLICHAFISPLLVYFGIHETERLVVIRDVKLHV